MEKTNKNSLSDWIKAAMIAFVIYILIRTFFFSSYDVEGDSMQPTLEDGNKLVVNKINYQIQDINRFDIIVFHANAQEDYVKRVIGIAGDSIRYKDDWLYVNGEKVDEPYLEKYKVGSPGQDFTGDFTLKELTGMTTVPKGKLFVMGDNRLESADSRHFGYIPVENVVGKVDVRYWPIKEFNYKFTGE
ncbi:signal peptidase I [Peribacillus simplex]|uniref:signal peptidase I n=1 Tax=Peribacillus simplex TaxID=1478 RepID=UPI000F63E7A1|nr:signal peptidase I [Peribacillus simplex]RRN72580.1 signal peptidase I [Peribacillus simplex]